MERTERDTPERFLHEILIMGELMQTCGAEVFRVEDTLARMGKAYGVERMNVFVITSSIVITMELKDGRELTRPAGSGKREVMILPGWNVSMC